VRLAGADVVFVYGEEEINRAVCVCVRMSFRKLCSRWSVMFGSSGGLLCARLAYSFILVQEPKLAVSSSSHASQHYDMTH